jgi:membrane protein DedA with SNARE-associated domain
MGQLVLIALATFASEDLTCIATGGLIAAGKIGFLPGTLACLAGIYFGDLLLYLAGRLAGRPVVRWRPFRRVLTDEKLDRASAWLAERGASVVILSRFTPGLRLPTYVAAGLLKTRFWTFALHFLLAAAIWTPILVGSVALLGSRVPRTVLLGPALVVAAQSVSWQRCRRIVGWIRRKLQWEFWPMWMAYLPLVPYLIYLACKHRSLTLFTAANPGIPSGGLVGESKSAILSQLTRVPRFEPIPACLTLQQRIAVARQLGSFPVVLKPDVGERGTGVAIARSESEIRRYFEESHADTIAQEYVGGLEFGVFYYRHPDEASGHIFSITRKLFPEIMGDGRSTLEDLVLRDERAVCMSHAYLAGGGYRVPAPGERVRLVELGSHCRGAIFLNGSHLETPDLLAAIDEVAQSHPGFYLGRFDLRSASEVDFRAGRFQVLELNGVSAEPTHIYDPSVSLLDAYRAMFRQWRMAYEIGAANRNRGAAPMSFRELMALVKQRA